jgi:hypothetical protein
VGGVDLPHPGGQVAAVERHGNRAGGTALALVGEGGHRGPWSGGDDAVGASRLEIMDGAG